MAARSLTLGLLMLAGCGQVSGEEQAALLAKLDAAQETVAAQEDARVQGLRTVFDAATVTAKACPSDVKFVDRSDNPIPEHLPPNTGSHNLVEGSADDLLSRTGFRTEWAQFRLDSLRSTVEAQSPMHTVRSVVGGGTVIGHADVPRFEDRIARLADPSKKHRYEVVLSWMEVERKLVVKGKSFPSRIRARALVWDHAAADVACIAQVEEVPDDSIEVLYYQREGMTQEDIHDAAGRHLFQKVRRAAFERLGLQPAAPERS